MLTIGYRVPGMALLVCGMANTELKHAIVRVLGPLDVARERLRSRGVEIRRELKLIRGFAVSAPARVLDALTKESWVTSVEPDREVRALD